MRGSIAKSDDSKKPSFSEGLMILDYSRVRAGRLLILVTKESTRLVRPELSIDTLVLQ